MANISNEELRKIITAILKDADLTTMLVKKVRLQIEGKLDIDLTERKKEFDSLVMECLQGKQDGAKKKKTASEESEDGEEEEKEGSEEEEREEEKQPAKRNPAKKAMNKRKKGSSDDKESASDSDASDEESANDSDASNEEYSPKKPKATPKKNKPGKNGKEKGSDRDSDEDWGKNKKAQGGDGGGAKKNGSKVKGDYTRGITLSPELAAVVGAEQMARHEVLKKICSVIEERNLYDPKNKQFVICDDELMKVIGVKRFRTFGMMKYLKKHFVD